MSFTKGHKRRPTSIATDEILRSSKSNTYITADGHVLQSSMVKSGSPSKRQLTGSTSQVRFSLPAQADHGSDSGFSQNSDEEDDHTDDSFLSGDSWQDTDEERETDEYDRDASFDRKQVVNITNHTIMEPPRGRSGQQKDRLSVANSMRALVSTSPDRSKLFVRPNSDLNKLSIPIPVEAKLPPPLSPQNKRGKKFASLIYNGVDYEPLNTEFVTGKYLERKLKEREEILPEIPRMEKLAAPKRTPSQRLTSSMESPSRQTLKQTNGIVIPDLSKPLTHKIPQKADFALDNEKEISNPSPAAKKLNNELNRRFSFPPRQHQNSASRPQSEIITSMSDGSDGQDFAKDLPPVPQPSQRTDIRAEPQQPTRQGLQIYNAEGSLQISSAHEQERTIFGRFGGAGNRRSLPVSAAPSSSSQPIQFHQHRRSRSQVIDFPVEEADIIQRSSKRTSPTCNIFQPQQEAQSRISPMVIQHPTQPQPLQRELLRPQASIRALPPNPPQRQSALPLEKPALSIEHEDSFSSIQNSVQDSIQESIQYSLQESVQDSVPDSSYANDDTQLFDLRDLIVTSGGPLKLTAQEVDIMDESIAAQSHIYDEPLMKNFEKPVLQSTQPTRYDVSVKYPTDVDEVEQPLGAHLHHQPVYQKDNAEADHIRSASQQISLRLHKNVSSPLMSYSSYQSDALSEPFSTASSAQTMDTVFSEPREVVDLTEELRGMTLKPRSTGRPADLPGPRDEPSYKSEFKEMDNGEFQETIILDDEDEEEPIPKLNIRHQRSKSNISEGSRAFSAFSFETIASEVQMNYQDSETGSRTVTPTSSPLKVRRYGSKRKSVIEMCDDAMRSTREVMGDLERQKTILIRRTRKLLEEAGDQESKLADIKELQEQLKHVQRKETLLRKRHSTQPSTASSITSGEVSEYFDYQNSRSYDFQAFMRSKSDVSLVELT